jgi:hypothetical protein
MVVVHRVVIHHPKMRNQGKVQYLLDDRMLKCRFLVVEFILLVRLLLNHPSSFPLGFPVCRVARCLRNFPPHAQSMDGSKLKHQDSG